MLEKGEPIRVPSEGAADKAAATEAAAEKTIAADVAAQNKWNQWGDNKKDKVINIVRRL